jgi:hypothetical protein
MWITTVRKGPFVRRPIIIGPRGLIIGPFIRALDSPHALHATSIVSGESLREDPNVCPPGGAAPRVYNTRNDASRLIKSGGGEVAAPRNRSPGDDRLGMRRSRSSTARPSALHLGGAAPPRAREHPPATR